MKKTPAVCFRSAFCTGQYVRRRSVIPEMRKVGYFRNVSRVSMHPTACWLIYSKKIFMLERLLKVSLAPGHASQKRGLLAKQPETDVLGLAKWNFLLFKTKRPQLPQRRRARHRRCTCVEKLPGYLNAGCGFDFCWGSRCGRNVIIPNLVLVAA